MAIKLGKNTVRLENHPYVRGFASVVSKKEGNGPLKEYFDIVSDDIMFGQKSWEKAENIIQRQAAERAMLKSNISPSEIDFMFAGDLLNQCIGSSYGLRDFKIPYLGLYGACSTMAEGIGLASILIDSKAARNTLSLTSSHFCSSERQFRYPLNYGGQRAPTTQWTITGSGAVVLTDDPINSVPGRIYVENICFGNIIDYGIKDINNMGAAMAPAAADTLSIFLNDTSTDISDYDMIFTGDLGAIGTALFDKLMTNSGYDLDLKHKDCGLLIFDRKKEDVHSGGSGPGCCASVLCSYILTEMERGNLNNILFIATGALMSTVSNQQKESIPSVAHLIHFRRA